MTNDISRVCGFATHAVPNTITYRVRAYGTHPTR